MAKPLSSLMQILSRPHNKELALRSSGLAQSARPFVGFFLFCIGKLLITLSLLYLSDMIAPGHFTKPLTVYNQIGGLMLSPLGLHSYLAYQEFHFYSFCSYYRSFAKRVLETSGEEQKTMRPSAAAEQEKNIIDCGPPREALLDSNLKELIDTMKNMTETFGPFLLQNFSLMLLYWLLHLYFLFFIVIQTIRYAGVLFSPFWMALTCLQFVSALLIVR